MSNRFVVLFCLVFLASWPLYSQSQPSATPSSVTLTLAQWTELKNLLSEYKATSEKLETAYNESVRQLMILQEQAENLKTELINLQSSTSEVEALLMKSTARTAWLESERWWWGGIGVAAGIAATLLLFRN